MNHWIVLGDTRVRVRSQEQLDATCRLFNLVLPEEEQDDDPTDPTDRPLAPRSGLR